ncbi:MAG TPA: hypothetical protein EYP14_15245 [Planctomycetaceae bacterium]|nr:hypothetical protein [Planctomycetaceae bacterium]
MAEFFAFLSFLAACFVAIGLIGLRSQQRRSSRRTQALLDTIQRRLFQIETILRSLRIQEDAEPIELELAPDMPPAEGQRPEWPPQPVERPPQPRKEISDPGRLEPAERQETPVEREAPTSSRPAAPVGPRPRPSHPRDRTSAAEKTAQARERAATAARVLGGLGPPETPARPEHGPESRWKTAVRDFEAGAVEILR